MSYNNGYVKLGWTWKKPGTRMTNSAETIQARIAAMKEDYIRQLPQKVEEFGAFNNTGSGSTFWLKLPTPCIEAADNKQRLVQ